MSIQFSQHDLAAGHDAAVYRELLLFKLGDAHLFGIDVTDVSEVVRCPVLRRLPDASPSIRGVMTLRGTTFAVVDLAHAIGRPALPEDGGFVIVCRYHARVHGLRVSGVERIIKVPRADFSAPPKGIAPASWLVSVVTHEGLFVEIIAIERVLTAIVTGTTFEDAAAQIVSG